MTEGKGSVSAAGAGNPGGCSLSRPRVALMVPSCGFWGCVHERVLVQTGKGPLSEQVGVVMRRDMVGQDVRGVYGAEKQSGDVCEGTGLDGIGSGLM